MSGKRQQVKSSGLHGERPPHAEADLRSASDHAIVETAESELNRRERIILIASRSFLNKGYSASSIDEIAEAAGTTGPALYRVFPSKQDILDKICLIGSKEKLKGVQAAIDQGHHDPRDTLREIVRNRIDFALGPWGCQVPIIDAEAQHVSPSVLAMIRTDADINKAEWFKYLSRVRPDTPTRIVLSLITAVIMEITYAGHHINELDYKGDVRTILQKVAWTGLMT